MSESQEQPSALPEPNTASGSIWKSALVPWVTTVLVVAGTISTGAFQYFDDDVDCSTVRTEALVRHTDAPPEVDEPLFPVDSPEQNDCDVNEYVVELNKSD